MTHDSRTPRRDGFGARFRRHTVRTARALLMLLLVLSTHNAMADSSSGEGEGSGETETPTQRKVVGWKDEWSPMREEIDFSRPLAMGRAFIGLAEGNAAYLYNPAGIAQRPLYSVSLDAEFNPIKEYKTFAGSIIDSVTSPVAAEVGYAFSMFDTENQYNLNGDPVNGSEQRHLVRLAIGGALGEYVMLGITGKYVYAQRNHRRTINTATTDVGLLLRTSVGLQLGVVGYNLIPSKYQQLPLKLGVGIGYMMIDQLYVDFDAVIRFDVYRDKSDTEDLILPTGTKVAYRAGFEYIIVGMIPLRVGYEYDGYMENHIVSAGLAYKDPSFSIGAGYSQGLVITDEHILGITLDFMM